MEYKLLVTDDFYLDVEDAAIWYKEISLELSDELLNEIRISLEKITLNPFVFLIAYNEYRRAMVQVFPYKILFAIRENIIYVVALVHEKRSKKFTRKIVRSRKPKY